MKELDYRYLVYNTVKKNINLQGFAKRQKKVQEQFCLNL